MNVDVAELRDELADIFLHKTECLLVVALDLDKVTWLKLDTPEEAFPPVPLLSGF